MFSISHTECLHCKKVFTRNMTYRKNNWHITKKSAEFNMIVKNMMMKKFDEQQLIKPLVLHFDKMTHQTKF